MNNNVLDEIVGVHEKYPRSVDQSNFRLRKRVVQSETYDQVNRASNKFSHRLPRYC
jgi:hypothetical protein